MSSQKYYNNRVFLNLLSRTPPSPSTAPSAYAKELPSDFILSENTLPEMAVHLLRSDINHLSHLWVFKAKKKVVVFVGGEKVLRLVPVTSTWCMVARPGEVFYKCVLTCESFRASGATTKMHHPSNVID